MSARALLGVAALVATTGCYGTERAGIELVVTADLAVPEELDQIRLTVTASRSAEGDQCAPVTRLFTIEDGSDLPLRGTIDKGDEYAAWLALRVAGARGGNEVLRKERLLAWPDDERRQIVVGLEAECLATSCGPDEQCEAGECVDLPAPGTFDDDDRWRGAVPCDARAESDDGA